VLVLEGVKLLDALSTAAVAVAPVGAGGTDPAEAAGLELAGGLAAKLTAAALAASTTTTSVVAATARGR
jgi:hypothetical protein